MAKWCGFYSDMVAINVDGAEFPCQSFQSNTTGSSPNIPLPDFLKWKIGQTQNVLIV